MLRQAQHDENFAVGHPELVEGLFFLIVFFMYLGMHKSLFFFQAEPGLIFTTEAQPQPNLGRTQ